MTALTETYDQLWSPLLDTVRADALDCVQANLAVLADRHGGPGAHLELGARLRLDTEPGPRVAASVPYRLAAARDLLGLSVSRRWDAVDGPRLRALVAEHGPLYVIADAHHLGWTPYVGRRHTEHTFVLSTPDTVVDAYHDETPWGSCRPGVWRVSPTDLDPMLPSATALLLAPGPAVPQPDPLLANARALAGADLDAYLLADRTDAEALVVDIWLLARSRLLHAAWLTHHGNPAAPELEAHARTWLTLASKSFVAARRSRRTGALPTTVLDELARLLHEDVALAARLAATDPVRGAIHAAIREVLRTDEATVLSAATLRDLPGYNSFRLLEIIECAEALLHIELAEGDLTAEALQDVDGLCAVFTKRTRSAT